MSAPEAAAPGRRGWSLPELAEIDRNIYRTIAFGFPLLTMVIITGAVWAQYVWQRWWSWDPKETASLVTWLIYAAYLHGRRRQGLRGGASAIFAVVGLLAVLFTYAGVNFMQSLHAYGRPQPSPTGRLIGGFEGVGGPEAALTTGMYVVYLLAFLLALAGVVQAAPRATRASLWVASLGFAATTLVLGIRMVEAGRVTFTGGYDFSLWFVWGIVLCSLVGAARGQALAPLAGLPLALLIAMYGYLYFPHKGHSPVPPALQNKLWLHVHVSVAIFAYGAFAVAAGWGVIYSIREFAEARAARAAHARALAAEADEAESDAALDISEPVDEPEVEKVGEPSR